MTSVLLLRARVFGAAEQVRRSSTCFAARRQERWPPLAAGRETDGARRGACWRRVKEGKSSKRLSPARQCPLMHARLAKARDILRAVTPAEGCAGAAACTACFDSDVTSPRDPSESGCGFQGAAGRLAGRASTLLALRTASCAAAPGGIGADRPATNCQSQCPSIFPI
jgi:hypothetical protein